ncbi:unnamed protein product [Calypogeia fissa]
MSTAAWRSRSLALYRKLLRSSRTWPGPTSEKKYILRSLSMLSSFAYILVAETSSQARKPLWSTQRLAIRIFFVRFVEKLYPGSPS